MRKQDDVLAEVKYRRLLPAPQMLRAIRRSAGVTQAAVAEVCGVNRASVSRWESGTRHPIRPPPCGLHGTAGTARRRDRVEWLGPTAGPGMRKLLTAAEVAEVLGIQPKTLMNQRTRREPPGSLGRRIGGAVRWDPVELEEWVHQQRPEPAS